MPEKQMKILLQKQGERTEYQYSRTFSYKSADATFNDTFMGEGGGYQTRQGWIQAMPSDAERVVVDAAHREDLKYTNLYDFVVTEGLRQWLEQVPVRTEATANHICFFDLAAHNCPPPPDRQMVEDIKRSALALRAGHQDSDYFREHLLPFILWAEAI